MGTPYKNALTMTIGKFWDTKVLLIIQMKILSGCSLQGWDINFG